MGFISGNGKAIIICSGCCIFCNYHRGCFLSCSNTFRFGNSCGIFRFGNSHFLCCHSLLVILHSLHSHIIKQLHNAVQILDGLAHLLLQGIGLSGGVMSDRVKVITKILYKLFQFIQQLLEDVFVVFCKLLHKVCIRQNICHSLCHNLTAGLVIVHTGIACLLIFDQVMHILSALGECVKNYLSKLIVLDRIPIFNKMCKFMGKSTKHCILCQIIRILDIRKSSIQVNVDGTGLTSAVSALCALKLIVWACLRAIQHNINASNLCHSAKILVCLTLGIIKGLFQIGDSDALAAHSTILSTGLTIGRCFVLCILRLCLGIRCCAACLISKLLLAVSQIANSRTALGIVKGYTASTHIIGSLVRLIICSHILPSLVGVDHSPSLCAILL